MKISTLINSLHLLFSIVGFIPTSVNGLTLGGPTCNPNDVWYFCGGMPSISELANTMTDGTEVNGDCCGHGSNCCLNTSIDRKRVI